MGWNQYHDKLTLNSSTSSSCKQEVWRLKRDLETSSGVGGGQDYVNVMPQQNKQEMTGDEANTRCDVSQIATQRVWIMPIFVSPTALIHEVVLGTD